MPNYTLGTASTPLDSVAYTLAGGTPTCTGAKNQICYIITGDTGTGKPIIDCSLEREIASALNLRTDTARVFLKP